jgi:hypothetical protein
MVAMATRARANATKPVLANLQMRFICILLVLLAILLSCGFFAGEIADEATFTQSQLRFRRRGSTRQNIKPMAVDTVMALRLTSLGISIYSRRRY